MADNIRLPLSRSEKLLKGNKKQKHYEFAKVIISSMFSWEKYEEDGFECNDIDEYEEMEDFDIEETASTKCSHYFGYYDYYEKNNRSKMQKKRPKKLPSAITNDTKINVKNIEVALSNNCYNISHAKLSKLQKKMDNKTENFSNRKHNVAKKLTKLGLRRRNECPNTSLDKPMAEQHRFAVNSQSACFGEKSQDFIDLQYRELTPNDYDLLLTLDETIQKKTVAKNALEKIETKTVPAWMKEADDVCCICLQIFDQTMKQLPTCGHCFHVSCIDIWLGTASNVCPVDQQKVIL